MASKQEHEMASSKGAERSELDLGKILQILWDSRKVILVITLVFAVPALVYVIISPSYYEAVVKIMPERKSTNNILSQYAGLAAMVGINVANTGNDRGILYPEIVKSNFVLDRVLRHHFNTSSHEKPVTFFTFQGIEVDTADAEDQHRKHEEAKEILRENYISTEIDKKTNLFILKVTSPNDAVMAAGLANFLCDQLDTYNRHFRRYKTTDQREYIDKSLLKTGKELEKAKQALKEFREQNRDLSSPEKHLQFERLQMDVEVQRTVYTELRKQLEIAKIEEVKETETIDILERAVIPVKSSGPKSVQIIVMFTFMGFVFSLIYISGYNFWQNNRNLFQLKKK